MFDNVHQKQTSHSRSFVFHQLKERIDQKMDTVNIILCSLYFPRSCLGRDMNSSDESYLLHGNRGGDGGDGGGGGGYILCVFTHINLYSISLLLA